METSEDTETSIEYKYLISGASWYPKYSLQLTDESRNGQLSWFALIRNDTGEDWEKVKLFFTASNPNLDIDLPIVREWKIQTQTSVEDSKEYPNDENDSPYAMCGAVQGEVIKKEVETEKSPKKKSRLRHSKSNAYEQNVSTYKNSQAPIKQSRQILQDNYSNRQNSIKTEDNLNQLKNDLANQ